MDDLWVGAIAVGVIGAVVYIPCVVCEIIFRL